MNLGGKLLVAFGAMAIILLAPLFSRAAEPTIAISEVAWAGSSLNSSDEYLELYNYGDEPIDLSGFIIEKAATSGKDLILPDESIIEPHSTFVIANYDHDQSILAESADFVTASLSLSNSKLELVLRDLDGGYLDGAGDGGSPFAGRTCTGAEGCVSMVRVALATDGALASAWADSENSAGLDAEAPDLGTPGGHATFAAPEEPEPIPEEPDEPVKNESSIMHYPEKTLLINEIVSNPETGVDEYVEIYNPYNNVIDLAGWTIRDASGKATPLPDQLLGMHQYVLIENPKGALNNDADIVILVAPTGGIVHLVEYGTEHISAPNKGESLSRNGGEFQLTPVLTPKWENVFPSPVQEEQVEITEPIEENEPAEKPVVVATAESEPPPSIKPFTLKLFEIYPNTEGSDLEEEFVEVMNIGSEPVEAKGLVLEDRSGDRFVLDRPVMLDAGEILTLSREETKLSLNNSEETVRLYDPNGKLIDLKAYADAKQGLSLARMGNDWRWTTSVTPNQSNVFTESIIDEPKPKSPTARRSSARAASHALRPASIAEAKALPDNRRVRLEAIITVAPGVLGKQIFYAQDESGGMQIYKHDARFPELAIGDRVKLSGTLSTSRGERRVKIMKGDTVSVLESGAGLEAKPLADGEVGELVTVSGTVLTRSGSTVALETPDGEVALKLSATGIETELFERGATVTAAGILRQSAGASQISPRGQMDLEIREPEPAPVVTTGKQEALAAQNRAAEFLMILSLLVLAGFASYHLTPKLMQFYGTRRALRLKA